MPTVEAGCQAFSNEGKTGFSCIAAQAGTQTIDDAPVASRPAARQKEVMPMYDMRVGVTGEVTH